MAKTRAEREAEFRAEHGVSSGTYYAMRRKAADRGISPTTFDRLADRQGYAGAKAVAIEARSDRHSARETAAGMLDFTWSDFDTSLDIPDDFDWWYH